MRYDDLTAICEAGTLASAPARSPRPSWNATARSPWNATARPPWNAATVATSHATVTTGRVDPRHTAVAARHAFAATALLSVEAGHGRAVGIYRAALGNGQLLTALCRESWHDDFLPIPPWPEILPRPPGGVKARI